jgi:DNA-binding CsgD family transcriptional regulator
VEERPAGQGPPDSEWGDAWDDVERGRDCYARRAWAAAHEALSRADGVSPLGGEDLERLALASYLIGRDDDYITLLQRAYHGYLAAGASANAARAAFWLGLRLLFRGETGHSSGWFGRVRRLVDGGSRESVERGYLMLAVTQLQIGAGDLAAARESAEGAARIGERFSEPDLVATARHLLGLICLQQGQVHEGLSLLDEAMLAVTGGELSPLVTGLIYCSVIEGCQQVFALGRVREWTRALADWCEQQREMVAFAGICSVHRAENLLFQGAWGEAESEAQRAIVRCRAVNRRATGAAYYQQGELHRLRGELAAAEAAYQNAGQWGFEPQPGLALLSLVQMRAEGAAGAIRRALAATNDRSQRARLLPAYVDIMLAVGSSEDAEVASRELDEIAARFDSALLRGMAAQAQGAVLLAKGEATAAIGRLQNAGATWHELEMPYLAARVRVLVARCCRALGDADGERLEIARARASFAELGARPDLARLELQAPAASSPHALTARELEVLRLLVGGHTNKAIAATLGLSEKTIERHVSNIFTKLDVPSRAAATAYAYEHRLL